MWPTTVVAGPTNGFGDSQQQLLTAVACLGKQGESASPACVHVNSAYGMLLCLPVFGDLRDIAGFQHTLTL